MARRHATRRIFALAATALITLGLAAALMATESVLSLWDRVEQTSAAGQALILGGVGIFGTLAGWLIWRLLVPRPPSPLHPPSTPPPTEHDLAIRLERAAATGTPVEQAQTEWQRWQQRRAAGHIYVAVYGEISSGKSALIRALLPEADTTVDVRGGTTRAIAHFTWRSTAGDTLILADVPGTNEADGSLDEMARNEARRAHIVIYVCDGDLSRSQFQELQHLLQLQKPTILAFNKTDRYSPAEQSQIRQRLADHLGSRPRTALVAVHAGGREMVLRRYADGREEFVERPVPPEVEALRQTLQQFIDSDTASLTRLRDAAVFTIVQTQLDEAENAQRRRRAREIVRGYTHKAVVGALAAVSPGTDVLIQGYLGVNLIKELCTLFETSARSIDIRQLLAEVTTHAGQSLPVILALAGNAFKAFPGIGTLAGGLTHAVAYGLIFETLGNAVTKTLISRGTLQVAPTASNFKENLGENLELRTRQMVALALAAKQRTADAPHPDDR